MTPRPLIVQFVHPGFEYKKAGHVGGRRIRSGVMAWKRGRTKHDRKFLVSHGSLIDGAGRDHHLVPVVFWGEWEGPSVFWKVERPGPGYPSIIHAPFLPHRVDGEPRQNTDPMVFGDAFIYSNCLQDPLPMLRALPAGSIILFGRHSRPGGEATFSLDTCLVVDRVEQRVPTPNDGNPGSDLLADAVLSPLHTEGATGELGVHYGRMRTSDRRLFSFFPAKLLAANERLFPRPRLEPAGALRNRINPANPQGIKATPVSTTERDAVWAEVVEQVKSQGCGLGYYAAPPVVHSEAAAEAVQAAPGPLPTP